MAGAGRQHPRRRANRTRRAGPGNGPDDDHGACHDRCAACTAAATTAAGSAAAHRRQRHGHEGRRLPRRSTSGGALLGTGKLKAYGKPGGGVVGLAAPGIGDGYATVGADGTVRAFGTVTAAGATSGPSPAVDIAVAATGAAVLGAACRRRGHRGRCGAGVRLAEEVGHGPAGCGHRVPPGGDGYWVLTADGAVRGYGAARTLGVATGAGAPVDVAVTAYGAGAHVLYDSGAVVAVGTATTAAT